MNPGDWEHVKAVFDGASDLDPAERSAFLEQACRGDRSLRAEVESLLAQASGGSFLERPAWQRETTEDPAPAPAPRRHPVFWGVWLAAIVVIAGLGHAASRGFQQVTVFGWTEARGGTFWEVTSVAPDGPAAGRLQRGDILLGLNGDAAVSRAGTKAHRRVLGAGSSYRMRIERGGSAREIVLDTAGRRRGWGVVRLVGFAWAVIGLFIGLVRPQEALARLAFAACALTGLSFLGVLGLMPIYALQPVHVLGYHFFYRFPRHPPRARGWLTLLRVLYGASLVCAASGLLTIWLLRTQGPQAVTPLMAGPLGAPLEWLLTATAVTSLLGAAGVAAHKYRALADADERRRFQWVALGGVAGLGPVGIWVALDLARHYPALARWLPGDTTWTWISTAANASSVALPLAVAYAVLKHQVFDARIVIRRGVQYLLARRVLQGLLALPVSALVYTLVTQRNRTLADLVMGTRAYLFWIAALILSLRFRAPLTRWLDRKFFREQYDSEHVLLSLVDEFGRFDSAEEISGFVCQLLERSLHPKSIQFWRRDAGVMRLADMSGPGPEPSRFPLSETLLETLKSAGPVVRAPLPPEFGVSAGESRWIVAERVRLMACITGSDRVEAVLVLGEKQSEEPYTSSDTQLVRAVARETAVILDNLSLKGRLKDEERVRHEVLAKLDPRVVAVMRECPVCGACYDGDTARCVRDGRDLTLTLPVPRAIDGKYRLDRLIGRGGMGAVYEARDLRLGREVAVKVMMGGQFGREAALRRFRREARAVARLNHPNIVALHDFGELEGGGAYLVMERIHGASLRAELKRVGVFKPADAAEWLDQVLDGLTAAHEHGVVHRDLKPENILGARLPSGALMVKVLDFGLAKLRPTLPEEQAAGSVTESGVLVGTLAYMAPEQFAASEVDQRADLFALGVVLAEMLTGRRPFESAISPRGRYYLPPGIPNGDGLEAVLRRCLAIAPADRFPSAADLRAALQPLLRA